jgi:hypothetical protein
MCVYCMTLCVYCIALVAPSCDKLNMNPHNFSFEILGYNDVNSMSFKNSCMHDFEKFKAGQKFFI